MNAFHQIGVGREQSNPANGKGSDLGTRIGKRKREVLMFDAVTRCCRDHLTVQGGSLGDVTIAILPVANGGEEHLVAHLQRACIQRRNQSRLNGIGGLLGGTNVGPCGTCHQDTRAAL